MIRKAIIVVLTTLSLWMSWCWVDSHFRRTNYNWVVTDHDLIGVCFQKGLMNLTHYHVMGTMRWKTSRTVFPFYEPPPGVATTPKMGAFPSFRCEGLAFRHDPTKPYVEYVAMPIWLPVAVFATYPTIAFIRGPVRRYRRSKRGLCLKCGYDLTGNVSDVCPECGTAV